MKSILIIGTGHFGSHLCMNLSKLNNEIMIVDKCEEQLEDLLPYVTSAKIGDCANAKVLESLGVSNFDICVVCIGDSFQDSLEITSQLKDLGAKRVVSKANRDLYAKFLLRNGADKVIFPDRDIAEKLAVQLSSDSILDYFNLTDGYSICEISPLKEWIGKTILEVNFRTKYHLSIIGVKVDDQTKIMPNADYVFQNGENLIVIGRQEDINKIIRNKNKSAWR
ncbi:MAG: TrkA family potassium uptake protein [Eubacterium sp.]|jgi:trk system potassium uptake protein TrkA|nr:TrkA family potassium uptake protein [Eubacterium sp.]